MRAKFIFKLLIFPFLFAFTVSAQTATRTITVVTEPRAVVWIDNIKYGATDESGKLTLKNIPAGIRKLRVRANGFKETTQNLLAAQKGEVKIALTKTADDAEIAFQEAERLSSIDREKAIEAYRKTITLRPKYAEANLELARLLIAAGDTEGALKAVQAARKARPAYAEASAVEGRIYVAEENEEKAVAAFKRAVAEGKGFQPEAHTGLGLMYRDKASGFAAEGDFENEKQNYILAAESLKKAAAQLGSSPDAITIYQLLGDSYERAKMYPEAIKIYEQFLRLFPDSSEAEAVRSFIVQIKKRQNGEQ